MIVRKKILLILTLTILLLPTTQAGDPQPSASNNIFYLRGKSTGDARFFDPWMNTDIDDPNSDDSWTGVILPAYNIFFNQEPPIENDLIFDKKKLIEATIHMDIPVRKGGEITVGLYKRFNDTSYTIGEQTTSADSDTDGVYYIDMEIMTDKVNSTDQFFFGLHLNLADEMVVTIYLDGSSNFILPITSKASPDDDPHDNDQIDNDGNGNGNGDPDNDNDNPSSNDSESNLLENGVIAFVIILIIIIAFVLLYKRYRTE